MYWDTSIILNADAKIVEMVNNGLLNNIEDSPTNSPNSAEYFKSNYISANLSDGELSRLKILLNILILA